MPKPKSSQVASSGQKSGLSGQKSGSSGQKSGPSGQTPASPDLSQAQQLQVDAKIIENMTRFAPRVLALWVTVDAEYRGLRLESDPAAERFKSSFANKSIKFEDGIQFEYVTQIMPNEASLAKDPLHRKGSA